MNESLEMFRAAIESATTTPDLAANELGVSRAAVYFAIKRGDLETIQIHNASLIIKRSLDDYRVTSNRAGKAAKR